METHRTDGAPDAAAGASPEEARDRLPALLDEHGAETRNLFLRDAKGRRHSVVCVRPETRVDLKALGTLLGAGGLRFASGERLFAVTGHTPHVVAVPARPG